MTERTEVAPIAKLAFDTAFDLGEVTGQAEYGDVLTNNTQIDWYASGMSEAADLVKYMTGGQLRYLDAVEENDRLRAENASLRAEVARLSAAGGQGA